MIASISAILLSILALSAIVKDITWWGVLLIILTLLILILPITPELLIFAGCVTAGIVLPRRLILPILIAFFILATIL